MFWEVSKLHHVIVRSIKLLPAVVFCYVQSARADKGSRFRETCTKYDANEKVALLI